MTIRDVARSALEAARLGLHAGLDAQHPLPALLLEALDAVPTAPTAVRSEVLAALALAEAHSRPLDVSRGHAEEALSIARLIARPDLIFGALEAAVRTDPDLANLAGNAERVAEMVMLAAASDRPAWRRRTLPLEARLAATTGDLHRADALLEELAELASAADDHASGHLADLRFLLRATAWGDVDDANDAISRVRRSADSALVDPTAAVLAEMGQRRFVGALFETAPGAIVDPRPWPMATMRAMRHRCEREDVRGGR